MSHTDSRPSYMWGTERQAPWNSPRKVGSNYNPGRGFNTSDGSLQAPDFTSAVVDQAIRIAKVAGIPHAPRSLC